MIQVKYQPTKYKRNPWPVWYQDARGGGTIYLPANLMQKAIEQHGHTGQAWQFRRMWKTYRPGGGVAYKSLEGLSPIDESDFWNIMQSNYSQELPPPSSFAGIFHRSCKLPWPKKSVVNPFNHFICGAWSEAITKGVFHEKIYHYDLNSAYRWAGCQGLPSLKSARRVFDINADGGLFLVEFDKANCPPWFHESVGMITSDEIKVLGIKPKMLFGVQFRDWLDLSPVFSEIDKRFPHCYKRISRAFWGRWNGQTEVQQHGWKNGHKVRNLANPLHNPIWSHYITSRVKLRLFESIKQVGAVHVQVDAVLCRDPLPTGNQCGDWKLVHEYPQGVWIHNTGQWGHGNLMVKRMGLTQREAEQWMMQKTP